MTLLRVAMQHPGRFRKLVLAGIGRNLFEPDEEAHRKIVDALEGRGEADDKHSRMFLGYASQPGNDLAALTAIMKRPGGRPFSGEALAAVTVPTLVVIGDRDFAGPGDPLVAALPDATLKVLRNTDHFATPESFSFIDAALGFIDAVPS